MNVKIQGRNYEVASLQEASRKYCDLRDASGRGASWFRDGEVRDDVGVLVARISYNGRVWPPEAWQPGMKPLLEAVS